MQGKKLLLEGEERETYNIQQVSAVTQKIENMPNEQVYKEIHQQDVI